MLRSTLSPRIGRSLFKQSFRPFPLNRRYLNSVPGLSHDYKHGVPGLLSEGGFDLAWTQYQQYVIERLNSLTAGMDSHTVWL
jgi:Fe-Mn family superoxide dismutase